MTAFQLVQPLPGVRQWATYSPSHRVELTSHAVGTPAGWWIFDPIPLAPAGVEQLLREQPACGILLTNQNHARAAVAWRHRGDCQIFSPDPAGCPVPDVAPLASANLVATGAETVSLEGGAPAEMAVFFPAISLVVFGDAVVHLPGRSLEILPDRYCTDPARLRRELAKLLARPFDHALFAHGHPLTGDARRRIKALL